MFVGGSERPEAGEKKGATKERCSFPTSGDPNIVEGSVKLPKGSMDPNNRALGPKYHYSIWALEPHYLSPWTLRVGVPLRGAWQFPEIGGTQSRSQISIILIIDRDATKRPLMLEPSYLWTQLV